MQQKQYQTSHMQLSKRSLEILTNASRYNSSNGRCAPAQPTKLVKVIAGARPSAPTHAQVTARELGFKGIGLQQQAGAKKRDIKKMHKDFYAQVVKGRQSTLATSAAPHVERMQTPLHSITNHLSGRRLKDSTTLSSLQLPDYPSGHQKYDLSGSTCAHTGRSSFMPTTPGPKPLSEPFKLLDSQSEQTQPRTFTMFLDESQLPFGQSTMMQQNIVMAEMDDDV